MGLCLHKDSFNFMRNQIMFGISQPKYDLGSFKNKRKSITEMSHIEEMDIGSQDELISMDLVSRSSKNIAGSKSNKMFRSKLVGKLHQMMKK
jgi:hypothetical protein